MKTKEFDYKLPEGFIAQKPASPRDSSRLLVLKKKEIIHSRFKEIGNFLKKSDVVVLNKSKVFPARLLGRKSTGGKAEVFLLRPLEKEGNLLEKKEWRVIGGPRLKTGQQIVFSNDFQGKIKEDLGKEKIISFNKEGKELKNSILKEGLVPTPPYVKRKSSSGEYQTVYAEKTGSVAAPTAGFHFTERLIKELEEKGVEFKEIILHVGLGTFQPIKSEDIEKHQMEGEWAKISSSTAQSLNKAKKEGRRIIAIGTTVTRTLENFSKEGFLKPGEGFVNLFIKPGYKFRFIDGLITNFHLPRSTPLLLVSALASKERIFQTYREAIAKKYRFYSFGDAMLII